MERKKRGCWEIRFRSRAKKGRRKKSAKRKIKMGPQGKREMGDRGKGHITTLKEGPSIRGQEEKGGKEGEAKTPSRNSRGDLALRLEGGEEGRETSGKGQKGTNSLSHRLEKEKKKKRKKTTPRKGDLRKIAPSREGSETIGLESRSFRL